MSRKFSHESSHSQFPSLRTIFFWITNPRPETTSAVALVIYVTEKSLKRPRTVWLKKQNSLVTQCFGHLNINLQFSNAGRKPFLNSGIFGRALSFTQGYIFSAWIYDFLERLEQKLPANFRNIVQFQRCPLCNSRKLGYGVCWFFWYGIWYKAGLADILQSNYSYVCDDRCFINFLML